MGDVKNSAILKSIVEWKAVIESLSNDLVRNGSKLVPVLLSGGSGSRLWPVSRQKFPKQFGKILDSKHSLIQQCILRLENMKGPKSGWIIVSNENHRFLIAEQLRAINAQVDRIILEPFSRNTAPAIAFAAFEALARHGEANLLIQTGDHLIPEWELFHQSIQSALNSQPSLCAFGVVPSHPETGYGYIKVCKDTNIGGISPILEFVEKPDLATAESFLASENYFWNSGMFLLDASLYLEELSKFEEALYESCLSAWKSGHSDFDFFRIDRNAFLPCPNISIDCGVMERSDRGVVVPFKGKWDDVGSWDVIFSKLESDKNGNSIRGDGFFLNTSGSYIHAESRLVVGVGLKNLIVVETTDAVLVLNRAECQSIKKLVEILRDEGRIETESHNLKHRPWGTYEQLGIGERFQVKRIEVNPKASLSLQMHYHRAEHWIVVKGTALVENDETEFVLTENQSTYIPIGIRHRLSNPGTIPLIIIEVQSGAYLAENDIVRIADNFGRV